MKKIKILISIIIVVIVIGVFYMIASMKTLNQKEVFYGEVKNTNSTINLYSKEDELKENGTEILKSFNKGDIIKVVYTDNKGVILETKKVNKSEVPKEIREKLKI
ncbi:hypothetical protein [Staphylococcus hyicus]|uniref:hypothetical protein n=1 Tax=Staphylococcus hyicus TaxID=1284 RepID=UPI00208ED69F|nr:hypothetical protein [Staphylococcus hyicus]MCO4330578.1 hypothetical protein [Staphylococcus hyicus]MCO4333778.1 hypothetical protein [Staphylococcus hyicus]